MLLLASTIKGDPIEGTQNYIHEFGYRIGWNLNQNGFTSNWSTIPFEVPAIGTDYQGADVTITDVNLDGELDIVVMAYENPFRPMGDPLGDDVNDLRNGANHFRYIIGWSIQPDGVPKVWSRWFMIKGVGTEGHGAGIGIIRDKGDIQGKRIKTPAFLTCSHPRGRIYFVFG
jgi:hypothetical protein